MSEKELHNDDELKEKAPFLFGLKKEEPFQSPEGYFEKFQLELQNKIHSRKSHLWNLILKPVVWAPAMVTLIVGSFFLFKNDDSKVQNIARKKTDTLKLNDISFEILDAYVNDQLLAQVNTDEIIEIVGSENIPSLGNSNVTENKNETAPSLNHLKKEEMEEYILENLEDMEVY
jgi:hypothetical protein